MSRYLAAFVLCVMAATTTTAFAQGAPSDRDTELAKATPIKIVSQPPDDSGHSLVVATWIMVIANAILCGVTWVGARNQSKDNHAAIAVGKQSADAAGRSADAAVRSSEAASVSAQLAARQQRDMLERETNIVAHRVAALAVRVLDLVTLRITLSKQHYRDFDSSPEKEKLDQISARAREATGNAEEVLGAAAGSKSDASLAAQLRQLDRDQVQLEAFKEHVSDDIQDLRRILREDQEQARRFQDRAEQQMRELRNR